VDPEGIEEPEHEEIMALRGNNDISMKEYECDSRINPNNLYFCLLDQAGFPPPSPPFVPLSRKAGEGDRLVPMIPGALPQADILRPFRA